MFNVNRSIIVFEKIFALILLALTVLALPSCSTPDARQEDFSIHVRDDNTASELKKVERDLTVTPEKAALHPDYQVIENIAVPYIPEYRVGPGDVVEIVYHIRYEKTPEDYRIEVQDKISITFAYHPQFNTTVLVRTDGKITVPLVGDIAAESKTPVELARILNREYGRFISDPSITVALEQFNVKIDELKKAITTAPRGQSKIAPVAPDGRISFPIIGNVQAEGMTVTQLEQTVNRQYSAYIRNLQATLILLEIHHAKFYIFGEIERPGAYEMTSSINLLEALGMANGYKKSANIREVVVFRNDGLEKPIALKVDLENVLRRGSPYYADLRIRPADIIFVPKTKLDNFNDLVEKIFTRGIYGILPFQTVFSINYDINGVTIR